MKKTLSKTVLIILFIFLISSPALAEGGFPPPGYNYDLSRCVKGDLYSVFTLFKFTKFTKFAVVKLDDSTKTWEEYPISYMEGEVVVPRVVRFSNNIGFTRLRINYGYNTAVWSTGEILEGCDWFEDRLSVVVPNMILFQNPDVPPMINPIMTYGEKFVNQDLQMAFNGFVGIPICQGPVYEWLGENDPVDMEGFWPCDDVLNELGGERFPLRCVDVDGEVCESLLNNYLPLE